MRDPWEAGLFKEKRRPTVVTISFNLLRADSPNVDARRSALAKTNPNPPLTAHCCSTLTWLAKSPAPNLFDVRCQIATHFLFFTLIFSFSVLSESQAVCVGVFPPCALQFRLLSNAHSMLSNCMCQRGLSTSCALRFRCLFPASQDPAYERDPRSGTFRPLSEFVPLKAGGKQRKWT